MRRIVHLSDLHFGRTRPDLLVPLLESVHAAAPDLVAVSGDLTQRARADQFAAARRFLAALPRPVLVVPGNHDVPLDAAWARLLWPWRRYRRWIGRDLEPWLEDDEMMVIGVNTVTPFAWQRGLIARHAVERVATLLGRAEGKARVVVTHHPFVHAPDQTAKAAMRGAGRAMHALAEGGADILLSGHLHNWRAEPYRPLAPDLPSVLLVQAGTGLSTRLRGEGNDYNLLRIAPGTVTVSRFATDGTAARFACVEERRFVRDAQGWRTDAPA